PAGSVGRRRRGWLAAIAGVRSAIQTASIAARQMEDSGMRHITLTLTSIMLLTLASTAAAKPPRSDLAGLRLGMPEGAAQEMLEKRGTKQGEKEREGEREEQESWRLERGPWGYVAFGVDAGRVIWVTAFARETGPRIRYAELG